MPDLLTNDGAHLHFTVQGSGPAELILLHGMGGSGSSWEHVLPHLDSARFRVLILDLRGHGKSRGGEGNFTFSQITADILAVANAAGFQQAIVVGFSGGAKNAVALAAHAPARVRGLVLLAPCGMGKVPLPRETLAWFFDYIAREGKIPPEFDAWFTPKIGAFREVVAAEYLQTSRAALEATAELWVHTSIAEEAARVLQPVLVLAGAKEPLYHPDYQRQTTLVSLPHAQMEILDCAHFMTFEEPIAVAKSLERFCTLVG